MSRDEQIAAQDQDEGDPFASLRAPKREISKEARDARRGPGLAESIAGYAKAREQEASSAASSRVKIPCGCYAEWTGDEWRIAASSFTCDHKQGDHVDGAPPSAAASPYEPDRDGAIRRAFEEKDMRSAATSFESAHPEYRSEPAVRLGREGMATVWDEEGRYVGCMGVELWRHLLTVEAT